MHINCIYIKGNEWDIMVKLYVLSNCIGSKKAENFLTSISVAYEKINLSYQDLSEEHLYEMDKLSEGFMDIVNFNASYFESNPSEKERVAKLSKKDLLTFVRKNPCVLSFPIVMQSDSMNIEKVLMVGYGQAEWQRLENIPTHSTYYQNINKNYNFKSCCHFDEVKLDDINLLAKV